MRKIFLAVAAMAMLATACTKDDSALVGNESLVSFSVSSPELQTRVEDGKGLSTNHLQYAFYDENGKILPDLTGEETGFVGSTTIKVYLVEGRTYSAIFWADNTAAPYQVDLAGKTMTIIENEFDGNADKYDAFYKYEVNIKPEEKTHTIELTRPFAQVNIATADKTAAANAGFTAVATQVTVTAHSTLNLATGVVGDNDYVEYTYTWANLPTNPATATVGGTSYEMLAMNYVLVNDKELVNVKMEVSEETVSESATYADAIERNYTTVPVQRNYRTYIVGNLLTTQNEFNVTTVPGFSGTEEYVANVATAEELKEALATADHIVLENNINMENEILTITAAQMRSSEDVPVRGIVIDGNGKTLTSTAPRAINVSGVDGVTIKNLTINASGERAINIINNATNVTIENVTATAANYTVNVAGSAPNAVVAIKNSTLNGLCTVNVAAAGVQVTVDNSTVNCNDNNTTEGESYAALCLNSEAIGGSIIATNTTVNVTEGSDSFAGRNGAEDGEVSINGSVEGVVINVAKITYPNSPYYYAFETLAEAIEFAKAGDKISLIRNITASDIIVINKAITFDGNGKTLTSTAGRAINVSGVDGVTIKNLTINASGERAINIIQNATNVTIDNVTATADNYTVNVASSAPDAVVAIKNSTLNGLCTVNVAAPGANVTVDNSTVNCNDNNTTEGESYAALSLNKDAVGAKIIATNITVNVAEGSDSQVARNGAENGTITIDGSDADVHVSVAAITYPGSDNYHGFATLAAAIEFAKDGDKISLIRDITLSETVTIPEGKNITIDLNGKTITVAETDAIVAKAGANLTIAGNGKVTSHAAPIRAIGGKITVESGEFTQTGNAVSTPATYRYSVDSREGGEIIIKGGTFKTVNGMINVNADSSVVIEGGKFENTVNSVITRHFAYVSGNLTIKDGEFSNKANSSAGGEFFCGAASTGKVVVEGGKFTSLWQSGSKNNIWASYYGGSIEVKGGIFNHNGGIATQVIANTDAATKDAYPYMAK